MCGQFLRKRERGTDRRTEICVNNAAGLLISLLILSVFITFRIHFRHFICAKRVISTVFQKLPRQMLYIKNVEQQVIKPYTET